MQRFLLGLMALGLLLAVTVCVIDVDLHTPPKCTDPVTLEALDAELQRILNSETNKVYAQK